MKKEFKLRGHIIDSLTLSKLLDEISDTGATCYATEVFVGPKRQDVSEAMFVIEEDEPATMEKAVEIAKKHGAVEV